MADSGLAMTHGGGLIAARSRFPMAPEPWIDLSTGINPLPYPLPPLRPEAYHRLPEPEEVRHLEAAAARAYGVADPRTVVAAPGTQILISLLPRLIRPGRVAIVGPTYAEHAAAWAAASDAVSIVADWAALGGAPVAVLCNPNNPDGRRIHSAELAALAQRVGVLVVDEAFADLEEPDLSLAPILPPNAIVLRSFGKTYGLAGLRLGFAVASRPMARSIRDALGPWPVSGPAVAFGTAALADDAWLDAARARLQADVTRLDALLVQSGFRAAGGTMLFRLARHVGAAEIFRRLGQAGILVRRFDAEPSWLRFGIPGGGWNRIEAALTRPDE